MTNAQYCTLQTAADIQRFQDVSNGLHDGYITRVEYNNNGISFCEHATSVNYTGLSLVIHVLVTSLPDHPVFEISFRNIMEWKFKVHVFSELTGFSLLPLEDGMFLWSDEFFGSIDDLKQGSYVIAESIRYRKL